MKKILDNFPRIRINRLINRYYQRYSTIILNYTIFIFFITFLLHLFLFILYDISKYERSTLETPIITDGKEKIRESEILQLTAPVVKVDGRVQEILYKIKARD